MRSLLLRKISIPTRHPFKLLSPSGEMGGYTVCPIISKASDPFSACHLPLGFHSAFGIVPPLRLPIRFRRHVRRKRNHSAGMGSLRVLPPGGSNAIGKTRKTQKSPLKDFFDNDKAAHPPLDKRAPWAFLCQVATPGQPRGTPAQLLNAAAFRP